MNLLFKTLVVRLNEILKVRSNAETTSKTLNERI